MRHFATLIFVLSACGRTGLEGTVSGTFGAPIPAATVTVKGSALSATTDADGKFALDYIPGSFVVRVEAPGHLPAEVPLDLRDKVLFPMAPVVLRTIPPGTGVQLRSEKAFDAVPFAPVDKQTTQTTVGLLPRTCATFSAPAGRPSLFGEVAELWIPRLDYNDAMTLIAATPQRLLFATSGAWGGCDADRRLSAASDVTVEKVDSHVILHGHLESGLWCLTQPQRSMMGSALPGEMVACFDWNVGAPPISAEAYVATVRSELPALASRLAVEPNLLAITDALVAKGCGADLLGDASAITLRSVRNAFFARQGFTFDAGGPLDTLFRGEGWYQANASVDLAHPPTLAAAPAACVTTIKQAEAKLAPR